MPLQADLVISFRASSKARSTKQQLIEDARKAEQQYNRILETLTYSGLRAVGRRGDSLGHLLIFVTCPKSNLAGLVKRERRVCCQTTRTTRLTAELPLPGILTLCMGCLRRIYHRRRSTLTQNLSQPRNVYAWFTPTSPPCLGMVAWA